MQATILPLRINITNTMTALDELANKPKVQIQHNPIDEDLLLCGN